MPPSDSSRDVLLEHLAADFTERHRKGECPPLSEYTARHPELAADIRDLFPALVQIENLKPAGDRTGAFDPATVPERVGLERLGDYRIVREVGRGGMGVVYEAEQESLGRHVALKVLPSSALLNPTYLERFRREARAAARLHHTNIVPVFGVGEHDGVHFYAMQFIQGEGLDRVLADVRRLRQQPAEPLSEGSVAHGLLSGKFTVRAEPTLTEPVEPPAPSPTSGLSVSGPEAEYYRGIARIGVQVAEGLGYAHRQGILHRDVKPSNLLLDAQGTVWITDFGLAKAEGADELTHTGDVVGTIRFMAPERFEGQSLPQSDVYALGLTLYELLTLRPAFDDTNKARLIDKVLHEPPVPPRKLDPGIPRDLETVVLKCLAKEPGQRYATAEALAEDLRRFLADRPVRARRATVVEQGWRWCHRNPWLAGLSAAILLLLLIVAVGSTVFALLLREELGRRQLAERDQLEKIFAAQLAEARARRYSGRSGQRLKSLDALRQAVELARRLGKPKETFDELRNEAIAALCLPDIDDGGPQWPTACPSSQIAFDAKGERYVQVDGQGQAFYYRVVDGKEERLAVLNVSGAPVWGEWHSRDLRFLALGSPHVDGKGHDWLKLWRCDGPEAKLVLEDRAGVAEETTAFRPDGRQLAIGHLDGTLVVHDTETGAEVRRWQLGIAPHVAAFHPRLPRLAVACGAEVRIYDVESGGLLPQRLAHPGHVSSVAWHPDGRQLAAGCSPRQIVLWDTEKGQQVMAPWKGHYEDGIRLVFNARGDRLLSTDWWMILRLWDAGSGRELLNLPWEWDLPQFLHDDQFVMPRSTGDRIRLHRFAAGRELRVLPVNTPARTEDAVWPLLYPRGRLLSANVGIDGRLGFDASGALLSRNQNGVFRWPIREEGGPSVRYHLGPPERLTPTNTPEESSLSRDGSVLAFAHRSHATVVHLGPPQRTLTLGPQYDVRSTQVSPDGRWVVTGSHWSDGSGEYAKVWEAATGRLIKNLPIGHGTWPKFSPDGRWLSPSFGASCWCEVGTWEPRRVATPGGVLAPEDRLLACSAGFGEIRLVDFGTAQEVARLSITDQTRLVPEHFSPDGAILYARGQENDRYYRWDLRLIRRQLAELDLDIDLPPDAEPPKQPVSWPAPVDVVVHQPELATDAAQLRQWELSQAALAWRCNSFDASAHARLGALAWADRRWGEAFAHLSVARALRPDDFEVRRLRALAARQCGHWAEAVADADWVLRQQPDHLHALLARAVPFQRLGRHADAIKDFTALLKFYPRDPNLHEQRARSHDALGDRVQAGADRKKAAELTRFGR
jgi:serine/threonine protein kinase/WD40 repeat protein